ncbi:MAG: transglycosylase SLT domain-containing protein [Bdellovibrionales bacterium]
MVSAIAAIPNANDQQELAATLKQTAQTFSALTHKVADAIKSAAAKTGVDFSYLLGKAAQESSFDANAKASTSSATGLYQFTNQTWLRMIKSCGAKHGLGNYASHITQAADGSAKVDNPQARQTILNLRNDPQVSALMAAELDKENIGILQSNVGGKIGPTELYLAHFLGASGASAFLTQMKTAPDTAAATVLPEAANANASVFYDSNGNPRTVAQIYKSFEKKFDSPQTAALLASAESLVGTSASKTSLPTHNNVNATLANAGTSTPYYGTPKMERDITHLSSALTNNSSLPTSVTGGLKSGSSSLFTTMVLAQMGMDSATSSALMGAKSSHENRNKSAWGNPISISG